MGTDYSRRNGKGGGLGLFFFRKIRSPLNERKLYFKEETTMFKTFKTVLKVIGYWLWTAIAIGVYVIAIAGRITDWKEFGENLSESL